VPPEITKVIGTKFAFKVFMDKFNATKLLPVFNVLRMSADPEIIESLHAAETPVKVITNQIISHYICFRYYKLFSGAQLTY
jgi:hypothetical protein